MQIKEIPYFERPQEKALSKGVDSLSNQELIALLLRTGTKNHNVLDISLEVLKLYEDKNISFSSLKTIKGIDKVKAIKILSLFELFKRFENLDESSIVLSSPKAIFQRYKSLLNNTNQELFMVLFLDIKNQLIQEKILFKGSSNSLIIDPKIIFNQAFKLGCSRFICLHNHPSYNTLPSKEDIETTLRLKEIGILTEIELLDHLIIGKDYYSFKENHLI